MPEPTCPPEIKLEDHPLWRLLFAAERAFPYTGITKNISGMPEIERREELSSEAALLELLCAAREWSRVLNTQIAETGNPERTQLIRSAESHREAHREWFAIANIAPNPAGRLCCLENFGLSDEANARIRALFARPEQHAASAT